MTTLINLDDVVAFQNLLDDYPRNAEESARVDKRDVPTGGGAFCNRCGRVQRMLVLDLTAERAPILPPSMNDNEHYKELRYGIKPTPIQTAVKVLGAPIDVRGGNEKAIRKLTQERAAQEAKTRFNNRYVSSAYRFRCLQCRLEMAVLLYRSPNGPALVQLSDQYAGANAHTPVAVAYYLDQAHRSHSVGANSAAVGAYRSAIENLLFAQGFEGMLKQQIVELDKQITAKSAPAWAFRVDPEYFELIRQLGNTAMHPNGGDITVQANLDADVVRNIGQVIEELLDVIYVQPAVAADRNSKFSSAVAPRPAKTTKSDPDAQPSQ
jgi:hypothetical protein